LKPYALCLLNSKHITRMTNKKDFIKSLTAAGLGLGIAGSRAMGWDPGHKEPTRIGIIGLDTSHSIAFTDMRDVLNCPVSG